MYDSPRYRYLRKKVRRLECLSDGGLVGQPDPISQNDTETGKLRQLFALRFAVQGIKGPFSCREAKR